MGFIAACRATSGDDAGPGSSAATPFAAPTRPLSVASQRTAGSSPGGVALVDTVCPADHPVRCDGGTCCWPGDLCVPGGGCQATALSLHCQGQTTTPYPCGYECCPLSLGCNPEGTACASTCPSGTNPCDGGCCEPGCGGATCDGGALLTRVCPSLRPLACGDGCCASGETCGPAGTCGPPFGQPSLGCSNAHPCGNVCVCSSTFGVTCVGAACLRVDGGQPATCPSSAPQACQGACCPSGATCGNGCGCPTDSPVACGATCCPSGSTCAGGADPRGLCSSDHPVFCGSVCCLPGAACASDGHCACPMDLPLACGDHCGPPGATCEPDGGVEQCPASAPTLCGDVCCDANHACVSGGCIVDCPSGTHQVNDACVSNTTGGTGSGSCDSQHWQAPCPGGGTKCCSKNMVCCHDSANGGAIGCEFTGFCQ